MDFWKPRSKRAIIDWLYGFYGGKYSKYAIRKKDVRGWYYKLRYSGARGSKLVDRTRQVWEPSKAQC